MTITEALAEIKTINKRITSKKDGVLQYLYRPENVKDPLEKEGGSVSFIQQEMQSISDLEKRTVELRRGIQTANEKTKISLEGLEMSIADWLIWRREIAPNKARLLADIRNQLKQSRSIQYSSKYGTPAEQPKDLVVNIDEKALASEIEKLGKILGELDGQLSLKNATITIH